jgi:Zn-dependent protease
MMGDINVVELVSSLIIYMVVLLLAISAHEASHAWMSHKFGDDTAYLLGRVTLNPVKHTHPVGTLLIPIVSFILGAVGGAYGSIPLIGWGIPTPVNPRNWTNYKLANVMVSIAGILANIFIATVSFFIFKGLIEYGVFNNAEFVEGFGKVIITFFKYMIYLNVSLAIFNLLPFPPLDGSKVLSTFLPASFQPIFDLMEQYGFIILMALIYFGIVSLIMTPVFALVNYLLVTPWF